MQQDHEPVDIQALRGWIGRETLAQDVLTTRIAAGYAAMLDHESAPQIGAPAPDGIHWCLAPITEPMRALATDGHPARGIFLPPVPLPSRMWAGGELQFHRPLHVGDAVTILSRIDDVAEKQGRSGPLVFVTVMHEVTGPRGPAMTERQDIVYRAHGPLPAPSAPDSAAPEPARIVTAGPVLLFRYSALTFNGHRIHYDRDYAMRVEGYAGLVVHGPLQATLMLDLAARRAGGRRLRRFAFRGVSPLTEGSVHLHAAPDSGDLWVTDPGGRKTMTAEVTWD